MKLLFSNIDSSFKNVVVSNSFVTFKYVEGIFIPKN